MTDVQIYEPEHYLLAGQRTPGLTPIKPSLESIETPPPLATRDSSSEPDEEEEEEAEAGKTPHREADYVLFSAFGPNYPDIANSALNHVDSPPRRRAGDNVMIVDAVTHDAIEPPSEGGPQTRSFKTANTDTTENDGNFVMRNSPSDDDFEVPRGEGLKANGIQTSCPKAKTRTLQPAPSLVSAKTLDVKPPPRPPPINIPATPGQFNSVPDQFEDSIAKSPALARFTINRADGDPLNTLPAMQMSPPRSSSNDSPELKQTLPSLETALSDAGTPFSGHSPGLTRPSPGQTSHYTPHSGMSPPPLPLWRTSTAASTPSDYALISAPGSVSTPNSSIINQSPVASNPTPNSTSSKHQPRIEGSAEYVLSPDADTHEVNGIGGSYNGTTYKCDMPDCTAAPFQTQYLLNSHMNVHSTTRPHFCPVQGCTRGPGGQGFKRKNEMIRHGLVHTSPGYMCPFCPEQQHKYPRPDNLQRHVRVHHVDKDRDHPLLREVLAQRPEGGSRGRRRRLGS